MNANFYNLFVWSESIAPAAFQVILNLVRPAFTKYTRDSVKVFGSNRAQWQSYLDKEIAKDQLYQEFGGTRKSSR